VPTCRKVNYKLNYKPGTILCPRTKKPVLYENVKEQIEMLASYPINEKTQLQYVCFCGVEEA